MMKLIREADGITKKYYIITSDKIFINESLYYTSGRKITKGDKFLYAILEEADQNLTFITMHLQEINVLYLLTGETSFVHPVVRKII